MDMKVIVIETTIHEALLLCVKIKDKRYMVVHHHQNLASLDHEPRSQVSPGQINRLLDAPAGKKERETKKHGRMVKYGFIW